MALSEQRAKDLAAIEPPGSITKIVQFAEQLSFGQDALFAGTDLPQPPIGKVSLASQEMAQKVADRPYAFFPGANGEGLDTLMTRNMIRTRDIQDFTRWIMRWEDKRSELVVYESPEQYFLRKANREAIEAFQENPEVQKVVLEGRRRRRVVEVQLDEIETEERVVKVNKTRQVRTVEQEVETAPRRGHPRMRPEEPDYGEYWKPDPGRAARAGLVGGRVASAAAAAPMDPAMLLAGLNRGVMTSNLGLGSLTTGVLKGRADATASLQAQSAATDAVQSSPVAPYMHQPPYPAPQVFITQSPVARPIEITTDWPGSPAYEAPERDVVIVPRRGAEARGIQVAGEPVKTMRSSVGWIKGAGIAAAAGFLAPATFGFAPGYTGASSQAFASEVAIRAASSGGGVMTMPGAFGGEGAMPAGSAPRRDVFASGMLQGFQGQPMLMGFGNGEPPVRTNIPASPLLGQITLISPPIQVSSQQAERAGTAVAFDIKNLAVGAGPLDAAGLSLLQTALPLGAQAIYPALPQDSLGPQAVNMKLAPSLLGQILTEGYGPQAATMIGPISAAANAMSVGSGGGAVQAGIVPTTQRPTDASAGLLSETSQHGPGSLGLAGAANASRGGALDFLGMPVRLAPSLSGNPDVKRAAEARKVLPPGAAAIMRPNEFSSMRSKVFASADTVHAEPDKSAWRHAAPSFGLRDAEPHTILSPDSRIKPPRPGAAVPQLEGGGQTPASKAMGSAAAMSSMGAGSMALGASAYSDSHGAAIGHGFGHGISQGSPFPVGGARRFRSQQLSAAGGHLAGGGNVLPGFAAPTFNSPMGSRSFSGGSSYTPAAAASATSFGGRVASRFSRPQPTGGLGPSSLVSAPATGANWRPGMPSEHGTSTYSPGSHATMASPGNAQSPQIPLVSPTSRRTTQATSSQPGYSPPELERPTMATTANSRPAISLGSSPTTSTSTSRSPSMPMAVSTPARTTRQSQSVIQKATGGAPAQASSPNGSQSPAEGSHPGGGQSSDSSANVNMLANEVWSLLKRKLQFEAERLGKRY